MPDSNELLPQDPGWDYGDVLPLARNKATGQLSLAIPSALRGAVNDLALAATVPGRVASGQMSLAAASPLVPRMALGLVGMGGMGEAPEGALRIFAGRTAKTADTAALSRAMSMESQGHAPGAIWDSTGWMKGPDGQWRFEIPDAGAKLRAGTIDKRFDPPLWADVPSMKDFTDPRLSDVIQHKELFKAYPDLADLQVNKGGGEQYLGAYFPDQNRMEFARQTPASLLSTALHETQHAVQSREGFGAGGSPEDFLTPQFHNTHAVTKMRLDSAMDLAQQVGANPDIVKRAATKQIVGVPLSPEEESHVAKVPSAVMNMFHDTLNTLANLGEQREAATASYRNLAGEVEARNVQERHASGETGYPPSTPGYTPWEQQIVKFDHEGNAIPTHRLIPVEHDPFSVEAYHGTLTPGIERFAPGSHFGTKQAAQDRLEEIIRNGPASASPGQWTAAVAPQIHKVMLNPERLLRTPDLGEWNDSDIAMEMHKQGIFSPEEFAKVQNEYADPIEMLQTKGHKGFVYENQHEGPGSDSYMIFDPDNIRHVSVTPVEHDPFNSEPTQ